MSGEARSYALDISEYLFYLTTDSLRLRSNESKRFQSLTTLVNDRLSVAGPLDEQSPETVRAHLAAIPTQGDIRITFSLAEPAANRLDEVKRRLSETLGYDMTVGDTLSVLLFHYVVEQKADAILKRLSLESALDSADAAVVRNEASGNVLPIR